MRAPGGVAACSLSISDSTSMLLSNQQRSIMLSADVEAVAPDVCRRSLRKTSSCPLT